MPKSNAEKQADLKDRRKMAGLKRKEYWATETQHKKLKQYLKELKS